MKIGRRRILNVDNIDNFNRPVTVADLMRFRINLLKELSKVIAAQQSLPPKRWLKSHEVQKLLKISPGTLQHLRDSGRMKFSKVGGIIFYDMGDVEEMINKQ